MMGMVGPLIGPIATGTGRKAVVAALRRFRKEMPAGLGATLKWVVNNADELEAAGFCPWCGSEPSRPRPRAPSSSSASRSVARKPSARQRRYGREFKRLCPQFKKKNGQWKKDGFKRCVRAAHRACK